jgi:hypothetical protein
VPTHREDDRAFTMAPTNRYGSVPCLRPVISFSPAGEPAGPLLSMRCHPKYPPCRLIGSGLGRRWWSRGAAQREPCRWGLTSLYGCCHWSLVSRNTGSEAPSMATSGRSWRARSGYRGKDRQWSRVRRCGRADYADRIPSGDAQWLVEGRSLAGGFYAAARVAGIAASANRQLP